MYSTQGPVFTAMLLLALLLPPGAQAQTKAQGTQTLTLEQTVQLAIAQAVVMAWHQDSAQSGKEDEALALSAFQPQFVLGVDRSHSQDLSADATQTTELGIVTADGLGYSAAMGLALPGGARVSLSWRQNRYATDSLDTLLSTSHSSRLTLSVSQPLLDGAIFDDRTDGVLSARSRRRIQWASLQLQVQDLVRRTEGAYWDVIRAQADLQSASDSLDYAQRAEQLTQERVEEGFLAPSELLQVAEQVATRRSLAQSSQVALLQAEDRLRRLLQIPGEQWAQTLELVSSPTEVLQEIEEPGAALLDLSMEQARRSNPGLQIAREELERARESWRAHATDVLPDLSLTAAAWTSGLGDTNQQSTQSLRDGNSTGWSVGLNLSSTPLLTQDRVEYRRQRRSLALAELRFRDAQLKLQLDVRDAVRNLELARINLNLAGIRRDLAERKLVAEEERVLRGQSTIKTLMDFLADRDQATRSETVSAIRVRLAMLELHALRGDLLERRAIDLDQTLGVSAPAARAH